MPTLMPLLDRDRYSDEEWALSSAGRCGWVTSTYPGFDYCGEPSDPNSHHRYCARHDAQLHDTPATAADQGEQS